MITNFKLSPLLNPKFIFTSLASYIQDGKEKNWEIVDASDSVAILLYHETKESFVMVKQFRPAIYANGDPAGMTLELCAGIVDKDLSLEQIAIEEIEEECGFRVETKNLIKVTSFHTSVGFASSKQTLYYAKINDSIKINEGGGIDDEMIEVIYMSISEAMNLVHKESIIKTPGLLYALAWWKENNS
ncbi:MAG: NUDIX domain-containing protein [Nitrososphaeraceae archaeon]